MVSGGQSGPVLSKMYEEISASLQSSLVVLDNLPRFLAGDPLARRIELLSRDGRQLKLPIDDKQNSRSNDN
jgi:hypothetical protein